MAYEPLHHKYRPQTFAQLVGQQAIATTLANALRQRRIAPAYLFCGPRGTGKTSSARILAKSLNCIAQDGPTPEPCGTCAVCRSITDGSALDFIEIDAASNTGVDNIRELIERAQFAPVQCRYKVYVIDECHMLSVAAFNALLKTLEEPPDQVVFVLATTDPQRVLPTIISRCQRFDYRRIPLEAMVEHLTLIAATEGIQIEPEALRLVGQISQGGLRDAESLLDQLSLLEPPITPEQVWDLVGAVPERDLLTLVQGIAADQGTALLEQARKLMNRGREPLVVLQNLAGFYRDLLIAHTAPDRPDLVAVTPATWADMQTLAQGMPLGAILQGQKHLREAEVQVKNTTQPRLWLEVTLMGLLPSAQGGGTVLAPAPAVGASPTAPASAAHAPATPAYAPPVPPAAAPPAPTSLATPPVPPSSRAADRNGPPDNHGPSVPPAPPGVSPPAAPGTPAPKAPTPAPAVPSPVTADSPSPAPASASAPAVVDTAEAARLWQQVVAVMQPLGSRALMQQHGTLVQLEGRQARVGIGSSNLLKMAQSRVADIEAAFQTVVQHPVTVVLEVVAAGVAPTPAASTPAASTPTAPVVRPAAPVPPRTPAPPPPAFAASPPEASAPPPAAPNPEAGALPVPMDNEFERAVKNFAQFFNGQVVALEDEDLSDGSTDTENGSEQSERSEPNVPF